MNKSQRIIVGAALLLVAVLYFGCDIRPKDREAIDAERAKKAVSTDVVALENQAKKNLPDSDLELLGTLDKMLREAPTDSLKLPVLEQLSSKWYSFKRPDIAGAYAQKIAEINNTAESWSITGTTFALGAQKLKEQKQKDFSTKNAVEAFENAISIEPNNVTHRVNLAVCYVENPPKENPMKGIQMLLNLDKKYPEAVHVQNTLAKFAIRTKQFDKAIARLEKVLSIEPNNMKATCLLTSAYEGSGQMDKAKEYGKRCQAFIQQ